MKKTKKMMMVLLTVSMVAMLLSGCKKKDLIVEESKEVEVTSESSMEPESMEGATVTPEVSEVPEATAGPNEAPTPVPEHTHSYNGTVTTQPTCGSAGVKTFTCSCGASYTESVPATGNHSNTTDRVLFQPTCSSAGYGEIVCNDCGTVVEGYHMDMLDHNFDTQPGRAGACTERAAFTHTCIDCGAPGESTYGETDPNNHSWSTVTDEVWDEENWVWYTVTSTYCNRCDAVKDVIENRQLREKSEYLGIWIFYVFY